MDSPRSGGGQLTRRGSIDTDPEAVQPTVMEVEEGEPQDRDQGPVFRKHQLFGVDLTSYPVHWQYLVPAFGLFFFMCLYGYLQELVVYGLFERRWSNLQTFLHFFGCIIIAEAQSFFTSSRHYSHTKSAFLSMGTANKSEALLYYFFLTFLKTATMSFTNLSMTRINYPAKTACQSHSLYSSHLCIDVQVGSAHRHYAHRHLLVSQELPSSRLHRLAAPHAGPLPLHLGRRRHLAARNRTWPILRHAVPHRLGAGADGAGAHHGHLRSHLRGASLLLVPRERSHVFAVHNSLGGGHRGNALPAQQRKLLHVGMLHAVQHLRLPGGCLQSVPHFSIRISGQRSDEHRAEGRLHRHFIHALPAEKRLDTKGESLYL